MDPFTLALATFGVQKLRGKSTKRSLRDAFIVGGGSQLFSMSSLPGSSMISGFGSGAGKIPFSMSGIKEGTTAGRGLTSLIGNKAVAAKEATDTAAAVQGVEGSGFMGMSPFAKLATVTTAAPLVEAMFSDDKPQEPPFSEQDYKDAYAR